MQKYSKHNKENARNAQLKVVEDNKRREEERNTIKDKRIKQKRISISVSIVIVLIIGTLIINYQVSPGKYDDFAKCLTEKGAIMQGEDWCQYTNGQKNMFGKSFKYVNYVVNTNLKTRPTWIINGESYPKVQSFERLSVLTGCKF